MKGEESHLFLRVDTPCLNEGCMMARQYYHTVELYYVCTHCGVKRADEYFDPNLYSGDDWDSTINDFVKQNDDDYSQND
jgi:hypothetical protein